jgi:hypothetical protein
MAALVPFESLFSWLSFELGSCSKWAGLVCIHGYSIEYLNF